MRTIAIVVVALLAAGCDTSRTAGVVQTTGGEVRLLIVPPHPGTGATPDYVLVNGTTESVSYGYAFVLDRWTGDEWRPVRAPRCGFPAIGLHLDPGERSVPALVVACGNEDDGLPRGLYRVTTDVDIALGADRWDAEVLSATFVVR